MKSNTSDIVRLAKIRSEETRLSVIEAIDRLKEKDAEITFTSVAKEASVSRNYLYKSEEFKPIIENLRGQTIIGKQRKDTKDLIIEAQKRKIIELTKEIKRYKTLNNLEVKYRKSLNKIEQLEKQLRELYKHY